MKIKITTGLILSDTAFPASIIPNSLRISANTCCRTCHSWTVAGFGAIERAEASLLSICSRALIRSWRYHPGTRKCRAAGRNSSARVTKRLQGLFTYRPTSRRRGLLLLVSGNASFQPGLLCYLAYLPKSLTVLLSCSRNLASGVHPYLHAALLV